MELQNRRKPKMCRSCLTKESTNYISIFKAVGSSIFDVSRMFFDVTGVKPTLSDKLPNTICQTCTKELCQAYLFRQKCLESDKYLRIDFFNSYYVAKILNETVIEEETSPSSSSVHGQMKTNTTEYLIEDGIEHQIEQLDELEIEVDEQLQDESLEENTLQSLNTTLEESTNEIMKQERLSEQFDSYENIRLVKSVNNYVVKSRKYGNCFNIVFQKILFFFYCIYSQKTKIEMLEERVQILPVFESDFEEIR